MKIKPPLILLTMILISCAVMAIAGVLAKHTIGKASTQVQNSLAIVVPLLMVQDPAAFQIPVSDTVDTNISPCQLPAAALVGLQSALTPDKTAAASHPHPVEESYFDDALFIGDSRTEGLAQYGRLGQADYFASSGMTVFNVLDKNSDDINFTSTGLTSLLASKQYGKIYIMLGINELGYAFDSLMQQYRQVLDSIRSAQPAAKIILCANIYVTKEKSAAVSWLSHDNITRLNNSIAGLADNKTIFYLDANELFCDASGYLHPTMTGDGVHPYATGYQAWATWLKEHGI
ncbi:MAG: hypothetical protein HP052_00860 [Firmicutes bacterium]|nr:hypothetical protein [Bacillota bacterium]